MYLTEQQIYRFEGIEVDLARECLSLNGEERHLRQKAFQVLVYLLERRERLVSKSELFDSVWPNTAVTDDVLVQCIKEVRRVLGDNTQRPRFIKTVPKAGYRFIGVVEESLNGSYTEEITRVEFEIEEEIESKTHAVMEQNRRRPIMRSFNRYVIVSAISLLLGLAGLFYFVSVSGSQRAAVQLPQIDGRKTVAVMYFENQSKSSELDWLRSGLADMLIAGLSRSDSLTVLSLSQLQTLLERSGSASIPLDAGKDIARQTNAEFFVTGSFSQIGDRVRLDVRLHDSQTGNIKSTETLTVEKTEQLLSEIDLVSLKISNQLNAAPRIHLNFASVMTDNLEAYRYYSLGVEKARGLESRSAIELLEKAVALDPEFAMAHARIGYAYSVSWGQPEEGKPHLEKAFRLSDRLTELDRMNIAAWYAIANLDFEAAIKSYSEIIDRYPFETEAYWRQAKLLAGDQRLDEATNVLRRGLTIDPNSKNLYNSLGGVLFRQGRQTEAIAALERYVALAPNEPNAYDSLGLALDSFGNYENAIENYNRALQINPKFEIAIVHLANAQLRLGQYKNALATYRRYIDAAPSINERSRGYDSLSYVYLLSGDLLTAEKYALEASKIKKTSVFNLYRIAERRGEKDKISRLKNTLIDNLPTADRGARTNRRFELFYRGMVALGNGQGDEAIEHFRQTLTHPPIGWNNEDMEDCLGRAYLRLGRFDEAIAEFKRILQTNPNYPLANFFLGEAYREKGSVHEAILAYRKFLEIWNKADDDIPEIMAARKYADLSL